MLSHGRNKKKHISTMMKYHFSRLENENVNGILNLLAMDLTELQAPMSRGAEKFLTAAAYGKLSRSVEKCEHRYECPLKLDTIQNLFPFQN